MRSTCKVLFISLFFSVIVPVIIGARCGVRDTEVGFRNPADGVCSNVDIRITMDQFRRLENCTVVEGFLHISLMERAVHEDYDKWSFPELREITAYLRLYRVYGLKTLRHLFPNLTVIGGRQLFNNYAIVAYEMPDLEELGLISLRTIRRGGVRITKSKKLCYVDTVDWGRLGVDAGAQDFKDNKEESQCANYCPDECPTTRIGNVEAKRCWTSQHCQLGLNCKCSMNRACMDNGTCCHEYCVGGCVGPGPGDCYSCKGVSYQGRCLQKCPPDTYMFSGRRCLKERECLSLVNNTEDIGKNSKILRGEKGEPNICITKCPQNYTVREEGELKSLECVRCQGFCPKVCNSTEVNSIEDAEKLKDCSKIEGPLIIQIMSGSNVAHEMEKNLGNIKEVTGYISIRRSYALLTLYFLKNLEIIGDSPLYQGQSLIVMDNSNLQELFPEEQMKKLKVKRGKVSFHGNRKLCLYKINKFVNYLNLSRPLNEQDISRTTNGDLRSCIEQHLNLTVVNVFHNTIIFNWTKDTSDTRHLLSYIINYKQIKDKNENIDIYQGRDACSVDAWMTTEQPPAGDLEPYQTYALKDLNAYSTYAIYVQAYTLPTATHSAMTSVVTVTTNPYYPSEPLDLEVTSGNAHELIVKWKPPKFPNGKVTHYKVMYHKQALDIQSFAQRDYCRNPANSTPKESAKETEEEAEKKLNVTATCCQCPKTKEELDAEARIQEIEIYFENYLHDQVYCQRYDTLPVDIVWNETIKGWSEIINLDRGMADKYISTANTEDVLVHLAASATAENATAQGNVSYNNNSNITTVVHEVLVYNATKIVLPNLEHYQEYNIEIQACHDTNANDPGGLKLCSNRAMTTGHTAASPIMDKINESTINVRIVENITFDVLITWEPPPNPNGLILTYNIFYKKGSQENLVPQQICVNNRQFQKYSGYLLSGIDPGNWTFQINAVSLAGNSSITAEKFFLVPQSAGKENAYSIVIVVVIAIIIIIVIVVTGLLYAKFKFHPEVLTVISPNINYVPSDQMYTMDDWEVDRDKIKLIRELGQGSFGMVYEGVAKGLGDDPDEEIRVAVKTVNDRASFNDKREFLKEATTMKAFDCYHVVKLLGVVSTSHPALVIMELMALGDLKNYLRQQRPDEHERPGVSPPKLLDILQMAGEIADGMAYLADKKFVHRDLAARNCMVAEDKTVKIGDFGMTRDIYETDYYRKGGKGMLPVRWMAPESLKDGVFTSMSDVWSYGVVMWEMVTLAAQPYQGLSNEEVVKFISEDSTMDIPDRCPEEMAYLMQRCWTKKPKNRPTFKEIIEYLLSHLNSRFEKVSYYFNEGRNPTNGDGNTVRELEQAEESDDASSLSCEGAAAPKLTLTENCTNSSSQRSPNHSGGSFSLYDVGMDSERFSSNNRDTSPFFPHIRDPNTKESINSYGFYNEFNTNADEAIQPFLSDNFQTPSVTAWQSSEPSPKQNGNDSVSGNSGLVELQPLINRGSILTLPLHKLNTVQSPDSESSEYIGHQPPAVTTTELENLFEPNTSQQCDIISFPEAPNSLRPGPSSDSSPACQQNWSLSPSPSSSVTALPKLRLPALNQPPSGGFRRVPLYRPRDRNVSSNKNSEPSLNTWNNHQTASLASSDRVVNTEGETNLPSLTQHNFHPPASVMGSSDSSKESHKNTGSDSFINGITNGHIPVSTLTHRTSLC